MNIFVLSDDPEAAAQMQVNKHVVKMPLETAQLLCSPFEQGAAPYKRTHYNHPCSVWTRSSIHAYNWLIEHGLALCDEYHFRYDKVHASRRVIEWCRDNPPPLPDDDARPQFAMAMPERYKRGNAVDAYRWYYLGEKSHLFEWKRREVPFIFKGLF